MTSEQNRSGDSQRLSDMAQSGIDTATEVAGAMRGVVEEMMAGFQSVTGKTVNAIVKNPKDKTVDGTTSKNSSPQSGGSASSRASQRDGAGENEAEKLVGQVLDLAQQMVKVAADASSRLLEVAVGPVESILDPDTHIHDDTRLIVGPISAGQTVSGNFDLQNVAEHQTSIRLVLINPLASTRGSIPLDRVTFAPNPVEITENSSASVEVTVRVPSATPSGRYLGIVRCNEVANLTLVLGVDVS